MSELQQLKLAYRHSLVAKAQNLLLCWEQYARACGIDADLDIQLTAPQNPPPAADCEFELHQALHRLAGSAPMYDFELIGSLAEQALVSLKAQHSAQLKLQLADLLRAMLGAL